MLFVQVVTNDVVGTVSEARRGRQAGSLSHAHVFADGDELHFRSDYAGAGVGKLRHNFPGSGTEYRSLWQSGAVEVKRRFILTSSVHETALLFGEIPVINRLGQSSFVFLHVAAVSNPLRPKCRQAIFH